MTGIMGKRLFYGYFFVASFAGLMYYFSGIWGSMQFLGGLVLYALVFFIVYWTYKNFRGTEPIPFTQFFIIFIYKISVLFSVLFLLLGSFTLYQNSISPAKMPLYTLSNGEKTIQFQAMSHIGREAFYQGVQESILQAKKEGYVLFFEGVRPGTTKNKEIFDAALGVDLSPELYENFSKLYGVSHQVNQELLDIHNSRDFNVDLDLDTIVELYKEKSPKKYTEIVQNITGSEADNISFIKENEEPELDINAEILSTLATLNERQLVIVRYLNQSFLNFFLKHNGLRDAIVERLDMDDILSVILDERNEFLVETINKSPNNKIFITYGLLHFEGVYDMLQRDDLNWEIQNIEYSYPISSPIKFSELSL